jgi:hypothetical protein
LRRMQNMKPMNKFKLLPVILLFPLFSLAQVGGSGVYNFLNLTNSARLASIGGYNVSVYNEDLNFAAQNPAMLNPLNNNRLVLNYIDYFAGINFGYTAYARDYGKYGTFAAGIHYLNYGKFTAADESGLITGEFKASDYAINVIWAKQLFKNIRAGVNFKPIFSHLESYNSFGFAFDLGVSWIQPGKDFTASLVAKNIGTQIKPYYQGHFERLPFELQAGVSKKLAHAPFRVSLTAQKLNRWNLLYDKPEAVTSISFANETEVTKGEILYDFLDNSFRHLVIGVDVLLLKSFYASIGYNHQRRQELKILDKAGMSGFSWGFGINLKKFTINYARSSYHLAGGSNHFSLQFDLSQFGKTKNVEINNEGN